MTAMRGLGLEPLMRASAFYPRSWNNREYDTGEVRFDLIFGESAIEMNQFVRHCAGKRGAALKIGLAFLSRFSSKNEILGLASLISNSTRYIDPFRSR
ncbi:hypothetical protein [Bradyrhizobium sp.]|uniref:hypothetical protein n=1 Tax=Bradyrhizobium sp. TaxID=376 RepID=UPI003C718D52